MRLSGRVCGQRVCERKWERLERLPESKSRTQICKSFGWLTQPKSFLADVSVMSQQFRFVAAVRACACACACACAGVCVCESGEA